MPDEGFLRRQRKLENDRHIHPTISYPQGYFANHYQLAGWPREKPTLPVYEECKCELGNGVRRNLRSNTIFCEGKTPRVRPVA